MRRASRRWRVAALAAVSALLVVGGWGSGPSSAHAQSDLICSAFGGGPPYAFHTYEASRDRQPYLAAQRLAARNELFPPGDDFALQPIETGSFGSRRASPGAIVPAELVHAIGWIESRLNQAAGNVPYETVGPVLTSSSCAYGIMQVASFFSNEGDTPSRAETLVGTHYAYNIAAGLRILVDKWNTEFFPQIGAAEPSFIESWYYATWAYNGWAFVNHPAGTEVDPFRTPYDCNGPYNGYPYQELVLGCVVNPPEVDGVQLWAPRAVSLPNLATMALPGQPLDPDVYFDGWTTVFAAPFTGEDASTPFAAMNMPLPGGSRQILSSGLPESQTAAERTALFPLPALAVAQTTVELSALDDQLETGRITIHNDGSGLLVYRLIPSDPWLLLDRAAGVAVGAGFPLLPEHPATVEVTITPDADGLPEGLHQGSIIVEALLPDGTVETTEVVVIVDRQGAARYAAGTPLS